MSTLVLIASELGLCTMGESVVEVKSCHRLFTSTVYLAERETCQPN